MIPRRILELLEKEYDRAMIDYPTAKTKKAAYEVIVTELDDLRHELDRHEGSVINEAIQVAAVSIRLLTDFYTWRE